jgi:hypothetical protein
VAAAPARTPRLLVIPFDQSFLGREDRHLEDRLREDLPAVLASAVAGWEDYRYGGRLDPPAAVSEATTTYRITTTASPSSSTIVACSTRTCMSSQRSVERVGSLEILGLRQPVRRELLIVSMPLDAR